MFRVKLPSGEESVYNDADDFTLAVQSGAVTPDAAIFHAKAERWVPVSSHPTYHRAVSATRPAIRPIQVPSARLARPSAPVVTAPAPALNVEPPTPPAPTPESKPESKPALASTSELELLLPDPMLGAVASAQRVTPPPSPAIPSVLPPPRPSVAARVAAVASPAPAAPAGPTRHGDDLVIVGPTVPESPANRPVDSLRVSAPHPALTVEPLAAIEAAAAPPVRPEEPAQPSAAESPGFMGHDQMLAFEPVAAPEPQALPKEPTPSPAQVSRPVAAVEPPAPEPAREPEYHHVPDRAPESWSAVETSRAQRKPSGNSPRLLLIAAVVVLMVAGVGLVAWRSGASGPAEAQAAPTVTHAVAAPAPTPAPTQASPLTTPMTSKPVTLPGSKPASAAVAASAPAQDSSEILPGRPQTMAMDIDVSGASVGQEADAGSGGSGIPLATVTDHYGDAAAAAASQLSTQMSQIGFSKVLAPVRFSSVEGMEGARHTISAAAGMLASYRSRIQAMEKAYGDTVAQSERTLKPSPRDILGWEHRLPNRETTEAAQVVDLSLTQVDNLFAALVQRPDLVQVSGETVTISDPALSQQYKALKEWLGQKLDTWGDAPSATVPPTVQQVLNAFVKGAAR
jgi:hypothetical protein